MEQKAFILTNKGMQRDLSISKTGESSAYENRNIRITATDKDTLFSVTNERGNKMIDSLIFDGELVGYGVLNSYLVLFTHGEKDCIYRVDCSADKFKSILVFSGDLGFDLTQPLETIVDYETEDIQKIYWIDGLHVLRFMNFSDSYLEKHLVSGDLYDTPVFSFSSDNTWFDSNRASNTAPVVDIMKDHGGNSRENGVAQYFITYYNKNGQQTGIIYSSPLVYLAPNGRGGAGDETNTNRITLNVSGLDSTFEYIRIYQIVRTSIDTQAAAYIIGDASIIEGKAVFVDDGAHREATDASSFLFIGSQPIIAATMAQKDGTLFLGNLKSIGNKSIDELEDTIRQNCFVLNGEKFLYGSDWESAVVNFEYSNSKELSSMMNHIPYVSAEGYYPYESQLEYMNSQISTFKGGEKYRFAVRFIRPDGTMSKSFWIGDKVNPYYPKMRSDAVIERSIAVCALPDAVIDVAKDAGFNSVQLMIARATYADRSVQAQGIVSPTVFNVYNRANGLGYAQSSWIFRPKGGKYSFKHFDTLAKADSPYSELQCSWWNNQTPSPLYYLDESGELINKPDGYAVYAALSITVAGLDVRKHHGKYKVASFDPILIVQYYTNIDDETPAKTYRKNLLAGTMSWGTKQLNKNIAAGWLSAYEEFNVPVEYRVSADFILELVSDVRNNPSNYNSGVVYRLDPAGGKVAMNLSSADVASQFVRQNTQYYFVDENTVTLNSPELTESAVSIDHNSGLRFRIVGASRMTGNITDYDISADNYEFVGEHRLGYNFSHMNISSESEGFGAWPVFAEYGYKKKDGTDDEYEQVFSPYGYMTYLWQKTGSIPTFGTGETMWSVLKSKFIANLHVSQYTVYNNYNINVWSVKPDDIRQITPLGASVYELHRSKGPATYSSDIDGMVTMPDKFEYPILYSRSLVEPDNSLQLEYTKTVSDPVHIMYKSSPHALIGLPSDGIDTILPYINESDSMFMDEETNYFAPWEDPESYKGKYWLYRAVEIADASKVADNTEGAYGTFDIKQKTDSKVTMVNTVSSVLTDVLSLVRSQYESSVVYVHIKTQDDTVLLVNANKITEVLTYVSVAYDSAKRNYSVKVNSAVPMDAFGIGLFTFKGSKINEYTITLQSVYSYVYDIPESDIAGYKDGQSIEFGISVSYDLTYIDADSQTHKLLPILDSINGTEHIRLQDGEGTVYSSGIVAYNAEYIDPASNSRAMEFINVAYNSKSLFVLGTDHVFRYSGRFASYYRKPVQSQYFLPDNNLIGEGDKYLFIGELYRDYDSLPVSQDTRYGGITENAVEGNTFVEAGPRLLLDSRTSVNGTATAEIDCSELIEYITKESSMKNPDFKLSISAYGKEAESITLSGLNSLTLESVLPSADNMTDGLQIVQNEDGSWSTDITGISESRLEAIRSNASFRVVVLRNGYARRGKWRKYVNKFGEKQSSHTTRGIGYRHVRRGYYNSLNAKRLRIIGNDLLISTMPKEQQTESSTWKSHSNMTSGYAESTLVSALGSKLVLPGLRRDCVTNSGRIANKSKDGMVDLFVALYRKKNGWNRVSNVVKVRGRSEDKTAVWEFAEDNIVYTSDNIRKKTSTE